MTIETKNKLDFAIIESQKLEISLNGIDFVVDLRARTSLSCFKIARQHYLSILLLLGNKPQLASSAHAIFRVFLEATLRGEWIYHCATEEQIRHFLESNKGQLDMSSLINAIDKKLGNIGLHQIVYKEMWPILSAYTHTYSRHVSILFTANDIESIYSDQQIQMLIDWSNRILKLIFSTISSISDK